MLNLFQLPIRRFPEGFLWGAATAGHQVEGNDYASQYASRERQCPEMFDEPAGMACNSWELFEQDVALLRELGLKAYRMSVEWSRIEPNEGCHDEAALERYLQMLRSLRRQGLHVMVTLHHFSHPQWFEAHGGFSREENLKYFTRHLEFLVPAIAAEVDSWCTLNEFNVAVQPTPEAIALKVNRLKAHALAYRIVHRHSSAPVSAAHALLPREPLRPNDPMDMALARLQEWMCNGFFFHAVRTGEIVLPYRQAENFPELKGSADFWGVNYYHRMLADARMATGEGTRLPQGRLVPINPHGSTRLLRSDWEREMTPENFTHALAGLKDRPVWITENGFPCADDRLRILYLAAHLEALHEAMELYGVKVQGYFHWSLMDNYEWRSFVPQFGLATVDRRSFVRTPKPSGWFYRRIVEQNALSGKMLTEALPDFPCLTLFDAP